MDSSTLFTILSLIEDLLGNSYLAFSLELDEGMMIDLDDREDAGFSMLAASSLFLKLL